MPEGASHIAKVQGLRNTGHPDSFGYVVFCRTRAGNPTVWRWFITDVAIPMIKDSNSRHQTKVLTAQLILDMTNYRYV